ncbi:probable crossover junction endonuclease EME2 isoform X2 [Triplophysa dalaica]|uniref:probable crossover junction endonuclease EME2 isoform X2 n=1 Tax=Triplophysa dalaica TaxID=1582913 RepID=UPI0024DFD112|nr:probable crossover junction endonuclease EME2 isoform X2 [Triplophysa dalaica]
MGSDVRDFSRLTLGHGCKCMPDAAVSVEDCLIAVSAAVGGAHIRSASRMNKAIVIFLSESQMVDDLIESGLIIKDTFVPVLPLSSPSKKVVLSNVPPFVKNDRLEQILQRYGKIVSPIKMIPLGCKNPQIKHVMSFRRQAFMILNPQSDSLNLSVKLNIDGKDYTIFISSDSMRCFICGAFGHIRQTCPNRDRPAVSDVTRAAEAENSERVTGEDAAAAAVASQPQPADALSAPGDSPEERPGQVPSKDGLKAAEEAPGPSHIPAVPPADVSRVLSQPVPETEALNRKEKRKLDKTVTETTDDLLKQSQEDISSQELMDLESQNEDLDNEYEDIETTENDTMYSELASGVLLQDVGCDVLLKTLDGLSWRSRIEDQGLHNSVRWTRQALQGEEEDENGAVEEDQVLMVISQNDFHDIVTSHNKNTNQLAPTGEMIKGAESLFQRLSEYFNRVSGKVVTILVTGQHERGGSWDEDDVDSHFYHLETEELLVHLQLYWNVAVHFLFGWEEVTDHVIAVTKALSKRPYKALCGDPELGFCMDGSWSGGVRVDRDGRGLAQVWTRQIQQLNRVSVPTAKAVTTAYPSASLLLQAYEELPSEEESRRLLADLIVGGGVKERRVGPDVSGRIHRLLTSQNPHLLLD